MWSDGQSINCTEDGDSASSPRRRSAKNKLRGTNREGRAASNHRRGHHPPHPPKATSETESTMASHSLPPPGLFDDGAAQPNINVGLALDLNGLSSMALNNNNNNSHNNAPPLNNNNNNNNNNNIHSNFLESPVVAGNNNAATHNNVMPRLMASPLTQQPQQHQINNNNIGGNGGISGMNGGLNMGLPMNAGHQMDVNMLYRKVVELSEVLKENREKTHGIISGAEELAARAAVNGVNPSLQEASATVTSARLAELENQLAREQSKVRIIIREQKENTRLIGEYETAVGNIVEMVRNYSYNNKSEKTSLSLHYNKLLQEEKDAHLLVRLEKDDWHAKFMRSVEMLREAYRIRCEEEELPIRVVSGLQNEVRAYRNALGMEPEKLEDEYGYEILKDVVDGTAD